MQGRNNRGAASASRSRAWLPLLLLLAALPLRADILTNYTLFGDQTFTSTAPDEFEIGIHSHYRSFDLQGHTATLTGTGNFDIDSEIKGTGGVRIDLLSPAAVVSFNSTNTYTGLTVVRSGVLSLNGPGGENNTVVGDLYIGGGPNPAIVTRPTKHNRELIADTATITIADNGVFELQRMDTGNAGPHASLETFAHLILDGGTLLNVSENNRLTTLNIGTLTLLSDSIIDLGVAMTMNVGDVYQNDWTPGAMVTIRDWTTEEPIYFGQVTDSQLAQIRFQFSWGYTGAMQLPDGQIVPLVPEASTLLMVPLLAAAGAFAEFKRRSQAAAHPAAKQPPAPIPPASKHRAVHPAQLRRTTAAAPPAVRPAWSAAIHGAIRHLPA